jgi:hypothetical protein
MTEKIRTVGIADFMFIAVCAAGSLVVFFFFQQDLNRTLMRLEGPLGMVVYKHKTVQRRFPDRVLWDRLREESPVYSGDFIRTAELSEVTVNLAGGDTINIYENTIIRIVSRPEGTHIDLDSGGVSAAMQSGNLRINIDGTAVEAKAGSGLSASRNEGSLDVQVHTGNVEVLKDDARQIVEEGKYVSLSAGNSGRLVSVSPKTQARLLNNGDGPLAVNFSWERAGPADRDEVSLDIASDRYFTRIVESRSVYGSGETVLLENGVYYWRAYAAESKQDAVKKGGISGRIQILYGPAPVPLRPGEGESYTFKTTRPGIRFQWKACEGATSYLVEVFENRDRAKSVYSSQIQSTGNDTGSAVFTGFAPGIYHWRVTPVYPRNIEGSALPSGTVSFRVEQAAELAVPEINKRQDTIYLGGAEAKNYFSWKQEDETAAYTFLLSKNADLSNPLMEKKVRDNYYVLDIQQTKLEPGQYYWSVYQTDIDGNNSAAARAEILIVSAGAPPVQRVSEKPAAEIYPAEEPAEEQPAGQQPESAPVQPEPLAAPGLTMPYNDQVFTEEVLLREKGIPFAWDSVNGASSYELVIYNTGFRGPDEVFRTVVQNGTSYLLSDLAVLDRGQFRWQITPVDNGRKGQPAEGTFVIDISGYEAARGRESGVMFGN